MADDETKQLLRDILATQREYLELLRKMDQNYSAQTEAYKSTDALYRSSTRDTATANTIANVIRALALLGVVSILGYLVLFGLHTHLEA